MQNIYQEVPEMDPSNASQVASSLLSRLYQAMTPEVGQRYKRWAAKRRSGIGTIGCQELMASVSLPRLKDVQRGTPCAGVYGTSSRTKVIPP